MAHEEMGLVCPDATGSRAVCEAAFDDSIEAEEGTGVECVALATKEVECVRQEKLG